MQPSPVPHNWKDPNFLQQWKEEKQRRLEQRWKQKWGIEHLQLVKPEPIAAETAVLAEAQSATARKRLPKFIGVTDRGEIVFAPSARLVHSNFKAKSERLFHNDLTVKANRYLACRLVGAPVKCPNNHRFFVHYRCGLRYCEDCGPHGASKLFARAFERLSPVAAALLACGDSNCEECCHAKERAASSGKLPHWPPKKGTGRPRVVVAKLDFTLRNSGKMPTPEMIREMNRCIKRFCRGIERRFGIARGSYGLAYCDELGMNNTNMHAHALYVGPWLPQQKGTMKLSKLWRKITGGSFIISVKFAHSFAKGLFHAVKYPAKFAASLSAQRFADLETAFHRVRRFHTLARFYNAPAPETKCAELTCPICNVPVPGKLVVFNSLIDTLRRQGYVESERAAVYCARARVFGRDPP